MAIHRRILHRESCVVDNAILRNKAQIGKTFDDGGCATALRRYSGSRRAWNPRGVEARLARIRVRTGGDI